MNQYFNLWLVCSLLTTSCTSFRPYNIHDAKNSLDGLAGSKALVFLRGEEAAHPIRGKIAAVQENKIEVIRSGDDGPVSEWFPLREIDELQIHRIEVASSLALAIPICLYLAFISLFGGVNA